MFIRYPHPRSTVPIRHFIPNLITTISLCCGLASIHFTLKQDWDRAILAVILAAVFDALDGRAARLLKVSSPFGAVLDSLSDFVSFGVAPAILLHQWMLKDEDVFGLAAVMTFALCSALRLARFTSAVKPPRALAPDGSERPFSPEEARSAVLSGLFFTGMPTPAAAAAVLIPPMLMFSKLMGSGVREFFGVGPGVDPTVAAARIAAGQVAQPASPLIAWTVILYTFLIALLMVSRIPMFSFKKLRVGKAAYVPLLVIVGLAVVLVVRDTWLAVSVFAGAYLGSMVLSVVTYRRLMARPVESFLAEAPARRPRRSSGRSSGIGP